jgi:DNA topoisomerase-1
VDVLTKAGISEAEAAPLITGAQLVYNSRVLKEIGIPAVSLKKYLAAGIVEPEAFCTELPQTLSGKTGMSVGTVQRHVDKVCAFLNKPVIKKSTKTRVGRGRKELLAVSNLTSAVADKLAGAGIVDAASLLAADAKALAAESGISEQKIRDYQKVLARKKEIIQL